MGREGQIEYDAMWGEQLFARENSNVLGGGGEMTQKEKRDEVDIRRHQVKACRLRKVRVTGCVR